MLKYLPLRITLRIILRIEMGLRGLKDCLINLLCIVNRRLGRTGRDYPDIEIGRLVLQA